MPNTYFYAGEEDLSFLLGLAFHGEHPCRVFETRSQVNSELREFRAVGEVLAHWDNSPNSWRMIALLPERAESLPVITRVELHGPSYDRGDFDYCCEGWGLIRLTVGRLHHGRRENSTLSHNSRSRAVTQSDVYARLGEPDDWNWPAVTRCARWMSDQIRRAAPTHFGSRPVLPGASASEIPLAP